MHQQTQLFYEFSGFQLDVAQRVLTRNGKPLPLTPKAFDVLLFLVQNRGRVLEKDELMKALWPESFVEEGNLSHNIFVLRRVLGDDQNGNCLIQTIPRRGYKFVAPVKELDASLLGRSLKVQELDKNSRECTAPDTEYWTRNSPFRSLRAFEPEDSWLFFGRESETEDLLARLGRSPVLVVVGNSGSGKSSLIRAGLIPALHQGCFRCQNSTTGSWQVVLFRPSGAPFDYLAEILPAALAPELGPRKHAEFIADCREKLPLGGTALRDAVNALANTATGTSRPARILLIADQFEEIFTLTSKQETRDRYINALLTASGLDGVIPVYLVFVLRADFYANCLEHVELSRALETNLYNVPRMAHEQLRESIEKRLVLAAGHAEPGLIDSLLADVGTEPGNLALLEHALGSLWEKCGGPSCTLLNKAYSEIGRLRGALSKHADEVYTSTDDKQKALIQKIFLELVQFGEGSQDTRRRMPKSELLALGAPEEVEYLLARLASSRLITTSGEGKQTFVEVSHEALIREWSMLREWIAQNRDEIRLERRLLQSAEEWHALGRDSGALLQGLRLAQAEEWLTAHSDAPTLLREFLEASIEARSEVIRKERISQAREHLERKALDLRLGWVFGIVILIVVVVVGVLWRKYQHNLALDRPQLSSQSLLAPFKGEFWLGATWLAAILLECVACWSIVKTKFYKSWKAFTCYLFFEAIASVTLMAVFLLSHRGPAYSLVYYGIGIAEIMFKCLVVLEILLRVLDPLERLPGRKIAWFCFWTVQGLSVVIAFSTTQPTGNSWFSWIFFVETTIFMANGALLLFVLFQATSLRISWKSSVAQIALGFAFYSVIQAINRILLLSHHNRLFERADNVTYLITLIGWIWIMFHRDPLLPAHFQGIANMQESYSPQLKGNIR